QGWPDHRGGRQEGRLLACRRFRSRLGRLRGHPHQRHAQDHCQPPAGVCPDEPPLLRHELHLRVQAPEAAPGPQRLERGQVQTVRQRLPHQGHCRRLQEGAPGQ
ncbi:hypothetical protein BN1708_020032, partial [Verticillium longisporum]